MSLRITRYTDESMSYPDIRGRARQRQQVRCMKSRECMQGSRLYETGCLVIVAHMCVLMNKTVCIDSRFLKDQVVLDEPRQSNCQESSTGRSAQLKISCPCLLNWYPPHPGYRVTDYQATEVYLFLWLIDQTYI